MPTTDTDAFVKVHNEPEDSCHNLASESFINAIVAYWEEGKGFLPLIGSGISAPSGIPIITHLSYYLHRCIALALGIDIDDWSTGPRRWWNPRTDVWPPLADSFRPLGMNWALEVHKRWNALLQKGWSTELRVYQEAFGAMADWRSSLQFLSRLVSECQGFDHRHAVRLAEPQQDVIDAFFLHVTAGRQPALSHSLLAHLAVHLRMNVLLTTNFDELLEKALEDTGHKPAVFDVHMTSGLPQRDAFRAPFSIVKMHGARYSLRGDFSLDTAPSKDDVNIFLSYLRAEAGTVATQGRKGALQRNASYAVSPSTNLEDDPPDRALANHLLITGLSGSEYRITEFFNAAIDTFPELMVFWLCYNDRDVATVKALGIGRRGPPRVHVLRHSNHGLFLLQLYESITGGLPPQGVIFPSQSRLPLPPQPSPRAVPSTTGGIARHVDALVNRIHAVQDPAFEGERRIVIATGPDKCGLTSAAATAFEMLQAEGAACVWLDMNDISSDEDLSEVLLDAISSVAGNDEWLPLNLDAAYRMRAREIDRITRATGRPWVIFLNARETPGSNFMPAPKDTQQKYSDDVLFDGTPYPSSPNGWLDSVIEGSSAPAKSSMGFVQLLDEISGQDSPNVTTVVLCRDVTIKDKTTRSPFLTYLQNGPAASPGSGYAPECWIVVNESCIRPLKYGSAVKWALVKWASHNRTQSIRLRFLTRLVLLQRSRYLAAFQHEVFTGADGSDALPHLSQMLQQLEDNGVLKRKAGGFVWLHTPTRNALRAILACTGPSLTRHLREMKFSAHERGVTRALLKAHGQASAIPSIHQDCRNWYEHVFLASGNPGALFEACYHALESARCRLVFQLSRRRTGNHLSATEVRQIADVITWTRSAIQNSDALIRRRGFSKTSCRRLGQMNSHLLRIHGLIETSSHRTKRSLNLIAAALRELQRAILTQMRGIAYEVSEFPTAFKRQRQLLMLEMSDDVLPDIDDDHASWRGFKSAPPINGKAAIKPFEGVWLVEALRRWTRHELTTFKSGQAVSDSGRALFVLKWWRWTARLRRVSRDYERAENSLLGVLIAIGGDSTRHNLVEAIPRYCDIERLPETAGVPYSATLEVIARAGDAIEAYREHCATATSPTKWMLQFEGAKIFELYAQLLLDQDSVCRRHHRRPDKEALEAARKCVEEGLRAAAAVELQTHVGAAPPIAEVGLLKVRLLLHSSIIDRGIADTKGPSKMRVMRSQIAKLNKAEAILSTSNAARSSILWAVLPIHRAILHLERAASMDVTLLRSMGSFGEMCGMLRGQKSLSNEQHIQIKKAAPLQAVIGVLGDARQCLDVAGRALEERRKNVFWSTWYFQRMLKLIECEMWARVADNGEAIPFLGMQAAPRHTPTIADECLEDTLRLVRRDSYRLATTVEAYARVALALHFRLEREEEKMPLRQQSMRDHLREALERLRSVHNDRLRKGGERRLVSKMVSAYIDGRSGENISIGSDGDLAVDVVTEVERILAIIDVPWA